MDAEEISRKAANLLQHYARQIDGGMPIGSMSVSIYDSAWVSMVIKSFDDDRYQWLYPEAFQLVLDKQLPDGGWETESSLSAIDGILNTMAALLAILKHSSETRATNEVRDAQDLRDRISRAVSWLGGQLQGWDVASTDHVGFEVLVPMHLNLLRQCGQSFDFPGRSLLTCMYESKMSKFDPRFLYTGLQTTFTHSLEAFIGKVDFGKVKRQLLGGSMMASPSATAAYLMEASVWDEEAEAYLKRVFENGPGKGDGGFPSAFPSDVFELSWVLSTLLEAGFVPEELGTDAVDTVANHLEARLEKTGIVGFSNGILPDADDTAKTIAVLNALGRETFDADKLIDKFWAGGFFRTYGSERNSSLSANCNALKALVALPSPKLYSSHISQTVSYLCDMWETDTVKDKWNLSPEYSIMLLTQGLMKLLRKWDSGKINNIPEGLIRYRIPIILVQALLRTLQAQQPSGSWGNGSCEVTAYALCTLIELSSSPWTDGLEPNVSSAISRGRGYLISQSGSWDAGPKLWIEKVSYKIPLLAQTYCIAALHVPTPTHTWTRLEFIPPEGKALQKMPKFFSKLPLFSQHADGLLKLQLAMAEALPFLQYLRSVKSDVFTQTKEKAEEDKYLQYIPYTWTAVNAFGNTASTALLKDMMVLSMLNYQIDEFMEDFVGKNFRDDLTTVERVIDEVCGLKPKVAGGPSSTNGLHEARCTNGTNGIKRVKRKFSEFNGDGKGSLSSSTTPAYTPSPLLTTIDELRSTLSRYTSHILTHASTLRSPAAIQSRLATDISQFLRAHVQQIRDNMAYQSSTGGIKYTGAATFHSWVRGTGSLHTSCPMTFTFFSCLISSSGAGFCFRTALQDFLAQDVRMHLASMCRIYNDCGSVRRDFEEGNLNSADFPGCDGAVSAGGSADAVKAKRMELLQIADYERERMLAAFEKLSRGLEARYTDSLRLFVDVTDLYGQIYVARDIGVATGKQR